MPTSKPVATIRKLSRKARNPSPPKWIVLRTGKGWVPLVEADAHLEALAKAPNDKKITIETTDDKKLVINIGDICTLSEFYKHPRFYNDNEFHLRSVSLVKRVSE